MPQPRSRRPALVALAVPALLAVLLAIPLFALAGQASTAQASAQRRPSANTLCPAGAQLRSRFGPPSQFAHVIHVPVDKPTIQGAVDAAQPGDLILIAPALSRGRQGLYLRPDHSRRGPQRDDPRWPVEAHQWLHRQAEMSSSRT